MTKLRIGMIGAGGIARDRHIPGLRKLDNVEFIAVANRHWESTQRAAKQYGFRDAMDDWREVASHPEVDAVFVCTPPYMHSEMTKFALSQGKHVFCQARMAMNLEDAASMLEADRATKLTTMLCPPPTYMKVEKRVLSLLGQAKIGQVRHVVMQHPTSMFLAEDQPLHWRQRADLQGINMLDVGIMGEVLQKWFGPVSRLSALGQTYVTTRRPDRDGQTEVNLPDSVQVIGEFADGTTLTALFSGAVSAGQSFMHIHGTDGVIECTPDGASFTLRSAQGEEQHQIPDGEGEWQVERDFVEAIASGRKGDPSFEAGYRYMKFTQAIFDSIRDQSWKNID